jgi:hypothetical protein
MYVIYSSTPFESLLERSSMYPERFVMGFQPQLQYPNNSSNSFQISSLPSPFTRLTPRYINLQLMQRIKSWMSRYYRESWFAWDDCGRQLNISYDIRSSVGIQIMYPPTYFTPCPSCGLYLQIFQQDYLWSMILYFNIVTVIILFYYWKFRLFCKSEEQRHNQRTLTKV